MKKIWSSVMRKNSMEGGRIILMEREMTKFMFAEDDQEDMSVDNCDCKLFLEFLNLFCSNPSLLWCSFSSWIAAETASGRLCFVSVCLKARAMSLITVKCEIVVIWVMKLY